MIVMAFFIGGILTLGGLLALGCTLFFAVTYVYLSIMEWRVKRARKIFTDYEQQSGHRRQKHSVEDACPDDTYGAGPCHICNLFVCSICGAFEGALLPTCPGRRLTEEEHELNYEDFINGTGPWAPAIW